MGKQRKKIIYVDDVYLHLTSVKTRMQRDYEVFPAQSVETLFEILENVMPDLILLDIKMPEHDGFEIIRTLKVNSRFAGIPVIFLSGNCDQKTLKEAMGLGAVDLVLKPFNDADLAAHIENQFTSQKQDAYMPVVLAVDDNPSILQSVNELLHNQYKVYTLPKPEAIKIVLKNVTPDLFLLDCKMPIFTGFDLIHLIRKLPEHKKTPIVFLTSESNRDTLYAAASSGISDYIVKPIDAAILRQKLAVHTADYMIRRQMRKLSEKERVY